MASSLLNKILSFTRTGLRVTNLSIPIYRFPQPTRSSSSGYNFELTDEQKDIQLLARKFAREEIIPKAAHFDRISKYPFEIALKAQELGLSTFIIPKEYGGLGLGVLESGIIAEELAYGCSGINAAITTNILFQHTLAKFGNDEQKKKYLSAMAKELKIASYCISEQGSGSDVASLITIAEKMGSDWVINGQKTWITNGGVANWYIVLARTNSDPKCPTSKAFTAFIVDAKTKGLIKGKDDVNMGQRAAPTTTVTFDHVVVPNKNVLLREGDGFKIVMTVFANSRPGAAAAACGIAQRALDEATKYSLERKTFGKTISQYQAIQFMLADMAIGVETSRLASRRAAWEVDQGNTNGYWTSMAKCIAADVANQSATNAVQIFGGAGFNSEYPVEKLMRDAKAYQVVS